MKIKSIITLMLLCIFFSTSCLNKNIKEESKNNDFLYTDFFLTNHNILNENFYKNVNLETIIKEYGEPLHITKTEYSANKGQFYFYEYPGIIYVFWSNTADLNISSQIEYFILTNNDYCLNNGIFIGMSETNLLDINLNFSKNNLMLGDKVLSKQNIITDDNVGTFFMKSQTIISNYDYIYTCYNYLDYTTNNSNIISECVGINIYIKDNKIISITTDLPTAG